MSREAMRKANHSMIERRRREKINAALGDLRDMVPGLGGETKGGEFKLEVSIHPGLLSNTQVLERTVGYMRELRERIAELEAGSQPQSRSLARLKSETTTTDDSSNTSPAVAPRRPLFPPRPGPSSTTPPSPSLSPDPNETEPESNLPPPYTLSSRSSSHSAAPTIASLIHTANTSCPEPKIPSRPPPGPQAANPTLYLPFPTPSPTSPFLSYHTSSSSFGSSAPEPSPFLAPLQNISLFGGALETSERQDKANMRPEEAANLLLAFSSPDTLHPVNGMGSGLTPKMVPIEGISLDGPKRERRGTLETEDFVLDGGRRGILAGSSVVGRNGLVGKTARDILKM